MKTSKMRLLAAAVAVIALLAIPAAASAAWTPTAIGLPAGATEGGLGGISCPVAGECVSVGAAGTSPMVATETAGTWGQATAIAPPSLPDASLGAISCPAVGECVAVGAQFQLGLAGVVQPIAVSETDGVWGPAVVLGAPPGVVNVDLTSVSCPAVGDCVAVGGGEGGLVAVTYAHGTWEPVRIAPPPGGFSGSDLVNVPRLTGVSCPAAGSCTAVGEWETASSVRERLPMYATETGGTWAQAVGISLLPGATEAALYGVSCPDATACVAVGTSFAGGASSLTGATETGGSWALASIASIPGTPGGFFSGVSCADADSCTAVGIGGDLVTGPPVAASYTGGSWSEAESMVPAGGSSQIGLGEVSCPGQGPCVAAGADEGRPVVYTGEGGAAGQGTGSSPGGGIAVTTISRGAVTPGACELSLAATNVPVTRAHVAQVKLTDTGGVACKGTVSLSIESRRKGARQKRAKLKALTIGSGSVALPPGATVTVPVRLNGAGKAALAKAAGRLKAGLLARAASAQITEPVELRASGAKHGNDHKTKRSRH